MDRRGLTAPGRPAVGWLLSPPAATSPGSARYGRAPGAQPRRLRRAASRPSKIGAASPQRPPLRPATGDPARRGRDPRRTRTAANSVGETSTVSTHSGLAHSHTRSRGIAHAPAASRADSRSLSSRFSACSTATRPRSKPATRSAFSSMRHPFPRDLPLLRGIRAPESHPLQLAQVETSRRSRRHMSSTRRLPPAVTPSRAVGVEASTGAFRGGLSFEGVASCFSRPEPVTSRRELDDQTRSPHPGSCRSLRVAS